MAAFLTFLIRTCFALPCSCPPAAPVGPLGKPQGPWSGPGSQGSVTDHPLASSLTVPPTRGLRHGSWGVSPTHTGHTACLESPGSPSDPQFGPFSSSHSHPSLPPAIRDHCLSRLPAACLLSNGLPGSACCSIGELLSPCTKVAPEAAEGRAVTGRT